MSDLGEVRRQLAIARDKKDDALAMNDALAAIRDYLHAHRFSSADTRALLNLMAAIEDARRGKRHPLLKPEANAGHEMNMADAEFRAATAAAVTLIANYGGEGQSKAERLRNALGATGKAFKKAGIEGSKIKTWHHEISNDRAPDAVMESYKFYLSRVTIFTDMDVQAILDTTVTLARTKL